MIDDLDNKSNGTSDSNSSNVGSAISAYSSSGAIQIHPTPTVSFDGTTPAYDQSGSIILGPGSRKEAALLGLGLPKLSRRQQNDVSDAQKYAMEQSIKHVLQKQTAAHQQQQQKMAMYAQALSLMGRVYVGSVSFELREETIKNAFSPFGPIRSINMSYDPITGHHKGFAFLEFEVPEAASLAQEQMDNVLMGGRNIKVGRPSNMPQAEPIVEMIKEEARLCNRIYVSSIHPDLTEIDVKSVFEAFGAIRNIELARGPSAGKHRGYAYIDYETEQAAIDAVASMNLFDLGGQFLRVARAITPPQVRDYVPVPSSSTMPTASAVAAAAVTAKLQALEATAAPHVPQPFTQSPPVMFAGHQSPPATGAFAIPPPGVAIPRLPTPPTAGSAGSYSPALFPNEFQQSNSSAVRQPVSSGGGTSGRSPQVWNDGVNDSVQPKDYDVGNSVSNQVQFAKNGEIESNESSLVVLKNMVGPEDVDEYLDDEVAEECSKYGKVIQVDVHRVVSNGEREVRIFVKFSAVQEAESAINKLDKRFFNGRQIDASFYDENAFNRGDFSS